ncbi:MAG: hypothetical protein HY532_01305 [Chloroflexi bacterium]|nr:hypothetical protein [Chloroflexota bacterium]
MAITNHRNRGNSIGGGNFTDYSPERHKKNMLNKQSIVVSGFVRGVLAYVIEFAYACPPLVTHIEEKITEKWPQWREPNWQLPPKEYIRSLEFTWKTYEQCPVTVHYRDEGFLTKEYLTRYFLTWIRNLQLNGNA